MKHIFLSAAALLACLTLSAQKYKGIVDKTVATVGGEVILLSDVEAEVQQMRAGGSSSDKDMRCEILQNMMESKLFLMQSRLDSLTVNNDMVEGNLTQRIDWFRTQLGGDEEMEKYGVADSEERSAREEAVIAEKMRADAKNGRPEGHGRIRKTVAYLTEHPVSKTAEIAEATGLEPRRVRAVLKKLIAEGIVVASGNTRGRTYRLKY